MAGDGSDQLDCWSADGVNEDDRSGRTRKKLVATSQ